jgi:site-specific recombinase XerD
MAAILEPDGQQERQEAAGTPIQPLVNEWLMDLAIQGRSEQTIDWYRRKMERYLAAGGPRTLDSLTGQELKRYLAELQRRELSADTVHGCFATISAFAGWAARENYKVDPLLFRVRAPKVPQKDMETYSEAQVVAILNAAPEGWSRFEATSCQVVYETGLRSSFVTLIE